MGSFIVIGTQLSTVEQDVATDVLSQVEMTIVQQVTGTVEAAVIASVGPALLVTASNYATSSIVTSEAYADGIVLSANNLMKAYVTSSLGVTTALSSSLALRLTSDEGNLTTVSGTINTSISQAINAAVTASIPYVFNSGTGGRWNDILGIFSVASGASALTSETYQNSGFTLLFMRHDQNDQLSMLYQMPHGWAQTAVEPHFHWMPCAAPALDVTQSIDLGYQIAWLPANVSEQQFPTSWTTGSLLLPVSASMLSIQQITEIIPAGFAAPVSANSTSALLFLRLMRSGSASPRDTYTTSKPGSGTAAANVAMLSIDVHFQNNEVGTINEWGPT